MLKISLIFNKNSTSRINNSRFIRISNAEFSRYDFKYIRTSKEIFKSVLVYNNNNNNNNNNKESVY